MKNLSYAKPIDDGARIDYAPASIWPNPGTPTEAEYNAAGWYRLAIQPPDPPEGKIVTATKFIVDNNLLVADYTYGDSEYTVADFDAAMEEHLREEREARGYTTREPDAYLTSTVPRWAQDAMDWVTHRDDVMRYALEIMNAVEHGEREPPSMEEFKAGLPRIEWTLAEEGA